jgi:hypothetical protein
MKLTDCMCGAKAKIGKRLVIGTKVIYFYVYCSKDCSEPTFSTRELKSCRELWEAGQKRKRGIIQLNKEMSG